jgi:hypothetical protein
MSLFSKERSGRDPDRKNPEFDKRFAGRGGHSDHVKAFIDLHQESWQTLFHAPCNSWIY